MASIRKYKTARGYAWRVQYRSPDGRGRTKQGFRTKAEAEAWSAKNATDIHAGQWRAPTKTAITVGIGGSVACYANPPEAVNYADD